MIQCEWEVAQTTNRYIRSSTIFTGRILIYKIYCGTTWTPRKENKGILILCSQFPSIWSRSISEITSPFASHYLIGKNIYILHFPSLSHTQLFATPWIAARQASLSFTISWNLLHFMSIESVILPNHLVLCHPLFLLPLIFVSIRIFSNELALRNRWPKYWSFSFSISPSNEYSGLISFRIDWLDLAVQGTLKSLIQHHSSKASVLGNTCIPVADSF